MLSIATLSLIYLSKINALKAIIIIGFVLSTSIFTAIFETGK